ncbi:hypothetical protein X801_01052, partial [Opisthorchis viverrini]
GNRVFGPRDIRNGPDCTVIVHLSYYSLLSHTASELTLAGPIKAINNLSSKMLLCSRGTAGKLLVAIWVFPKPKIEGSRKKSTVESSSMSTITNNLKKPVFPIQVKTLKTSHEHEERMVGLFLVV